MANEKLRSIVIGRTPNFGSRTINYWADEVTNTLNGLPFSIFSTSTTGPNSRVTAPKGFIGIDTGSSVTRLWVKTSGSGNTGWSYFSHVGGV